jgi:hypothetical protein
MNSWIFQANPKFYRVDEALKVLSEHTWLTNQHAKYIAAGDTVFIWRCGKNAALVASGTVLTSPSLLEVAPEERKFEGEPLKFDGKRMRVKVQTRVIVPPIPREMILKRPELSSMAVCKGCTGTNFALPAEAAAAIDRIIDTRS